MVGFPRKCQKPNFLTLYPLIIPGFFLKTDTKARCCTVLASIIMQK